MLSGRNPAALLAGTGLKRPYLAAFLASLFTAAAFILPFVLRRGGVLYISNDQVTQTLPFTQALVENIHSGNLWYDFNLDLGASLVEGYTYYGLGSVFTLPLLLFPAAAVPYLLGPALILKFGVAGLLSYAWLRRHTGTDLGALTGSLLYSFSAIAITNMVFPFADTFALFPLLPLGMDLLLEERATGVFALGVALCALANPPLFFGEVVFMVLYFAVRVGHKSLPISVKAFLRLLGEAVLGLLVAAFILLPFVASLAANPRVGGTMGFDKSMLFYIAYQYFKIFQALVAPGEVMHANSMFLLVDAVSPQLYLPLFALVPAFAYVLGKKRDWLRTLLIASFVCMLVPGLNATFNALNVTYYTRWLYMPALMAALATARVLEQPGIRLKRGFLLWGCFAAGLLVCMGLWYWAYGYGYIISYLPLFVLNLGLSVAGLCVTGASRRLWRSLPRALTAGVMLFAIIGGGANLLFNQAVATRDYGPPAGWAGKTFRSAQNVRLPEGAYRIGAPANGNNLYFGHGSPFSFTSTVPAGVFELQAAFGRQRTSVSRIEYGEPGLWSLLGVKYLVGTADTGLLPNLVVYSDGDTPVLENVDALPMVIGFDAALSPGDTEGLNNTQKSVALLHALVLDEGAASRLGLPALEAEAAGLDYAEGLAAREAMAASEVTLEGASLTARLEMPHAGAALITLPYDAGWRCTVNGEAVSWVKADWGLMAVPVPAGESVIKLEYRPAGHPWVLVLSGVAVLGLAALLWQNRKRKTKA